MTGISDERKTAFYLGTLLSGIGLLLFLSNFVFGALQLGGEPDFGSHNSFMQGMALRGVGGILLIAVGRFIRRVGARGLAGSGMLLEPEQAREDLKPYSKMAGGMLNDALEEVDLPGGSQPEKIIVIKCRDCGYLNEENSKFCQECGTKI